MSVFLGYLHPNTVSSSFHRSLLSLIAYDREYGKHLGPYGSVRSAGYDLPLSRNFLASEALKQGADWLFMVDADMGFQPDCLERLMEVAHPEDRPVIGGLCFVWKEKGLDEYNGTRNHPMPTIYDYIDGEMKSRVHYPVNQLVPAAATGAAMLLIHRSVLQKIMQEYGPTWFDRIPYPKGLLGEDISFCMRIGAVGAPLFIHTGVRTNHHKELFVQEWDFWESFNAPPADVPVDVIVPTVKARTANLEPLLQSLRASTGLATAYVVCDPDADEQQRVTKEFGGVVVEAAGSFARKINAAYPSTTAPWVKVVGDDCRFHPGWLDHAQLVGRLYSAKVVGSNDLANQRVTSGDHATHWMIARDYIDQVGASWDGPGTIAHEGYRHWFVDDEIVTAAKARGVFQAALGSIVEHLHPITGKVESDAVYEKNDKYAAQDHDLFVKRAKKYVG